MRCIEISFYIPFSQGGAGLTLTWDVLKLLWKRVFIRCRRRLTLTWDVLKLWRQTRWLGYIHWLTLTWDVLKSYVGILLLQAFYD